MLTSEIRMVRPTIRSNSIVKKRESSIYYASTIILKVMGRLRNGFIRMNNIVIDTIL